MEQTRSAGRRPRKLTAAAFFGMGWSYSTTIVIAIVQVVYIAVMSRLLEPRAFGIYAIAMLILNMGNSFARMGIAQALIQRETISSDDVRASATAGMAVGMLQFLLLWFLAPWLSEFFSEPDAVPVLRVMGTHFLALGFGVTSKSLLRRELRFKQFAITQVVSYIVGYGVIGISMAAAGAGVWSLVGAVLSAHFLEAVAQYLYTRHPLRPILNVRRFSYLYSFGVRISLVRFVEFLGKQLDTMAVGRYATTAFLGQYNRAFVVVNVSMSQHLSQAITNVLFPGFSKIQTNAKRLTRVFLSVSMLSAVLMFSVGAGMAMASREIVLVLLGEQWDVAMRVVPYFAVAVAFNVMTKLAELVCEARAELNKVLSVQGVYVVLLGVGYVAVSGVGGVVPFAATLAIGEVIRHVAFLNLVHRVLDCRVWSMVRMYGPALVSAGAVALAVRATSEAGRLADVPAVALLAMEIAAAAAALGLSVRLNPFPSVRVELRGRLRAAGLVTERRPVMMALSRLLVGRDTPRP